MWTRVLVASAVAAIAGSTFVYAQQSSGSDRTGPMPGFERFRPSADDFGAFTDARIAGMKAGLRLNAEQDKNWPAFEDAYRNFAKLRTDRILAFRDGSQQPPADMLEALQRRADALGRTAAVYKQIADATTPLYRSLDDAQKRRFAVLAPMLRQMQGPGSFRRGDYNRRDREDFGRGGQGGPDRYQQRGGDQPRFGDGRPCSGAMERIRFNGHEIEHDDSAEPGAGAARENGWR